MTLSRNCTRPSSKGFSLLETVLSLIILSIVMVSVGSAMVFAGAATPDEDSPIAITIRDHTILARIAEDLSLAMYVTEQTSNSITVIVPDRTGDQVPDRLRYAWDGNAGDPLTLSINGGAASTILDATQNFELSFDNQTINATLPGTRTYGAEKLISSYTTTLLSSRVTTSATDWHGQSLSPNLSADATGLVPTRLDLYTYRADGSDGVLDVRLTSATSGLPDGVTSYASKHVNEASLSHSDWTTITLEQAGLIPNDQDIAVYLAYVSGTATSQLSANTDLGSGYLNTSNSGTSWSQSLTRSLLHRLYGRELVQSPPIDITRSVCRSVTVSLSSDAGTNTAYSRTVRLVRMPELSDYFWYADFSADPTLMDLDGDGSADWIGSSDDFTDAELAEGVWTVGRPCSTSPTHRLNGVVTVDTRLRSTTGEGLGIYGPYSGSSSSLLSLVTQLSQDGSGGQQLSFYESTDLSTPVASITDLPQGWIDLRLTVITDQDMVSVEVNGEMAGTLELTRINDSTTARNLSVRPIGSDGEIDYLRVRVGGSYTVQESSSTGDLLSDLLNLVGF